MNRLKKLWEEIIAFFSDEEDPDEPFFDPVHLAGLVVSVVFTMGVIFWLVWTLLVFEGGFFAKVLPTIQVIFTDKTLQDFGWVGYPYELGIFEGVFANSIALILTIAVVLGIWWVLERRQSRDV